MNKISIDKAWENFVNYLNEIEPVDVKDPKKKHVNFLGSIEKYRKIFIEANKDIK